MTNLPTPQSVPAATPAPAPPVAPVAPAPTAAQRVTISMGNGAGTRIYSASEVAALRARREELSNQLQSADGRRRRLQESLRRADGADKAGLEQRLAVLDGRIARLEADIDENGQQLASLPAQMSASTGVRTFGMRSQDMGRVADRAVPIFIVFTLFVLCPMALSLSRFLWKRGGAPKVSALPAETTSRLERMEQAMDAVAIEVERISEGQRFVTRILSENRQASPLAAGVPAMEPVRVGAAEQLPARR